MEKFEVAEGPEGEPPEPTEEQIAEVEREQVAKVLKVFHDPGLREAILAAKRSLEQVIDEQTPDQLLRAGFDAEALEKAKSMLASFRNFIEANKDEIEALQVLYSVPYRAGLKFRHVRELVAKLNQRRFLWIRIALNRWVVCGRRLRSLSRARCVARVAGSLWT